MAELKPCPFCGQKKYIVVLAGGASCSWRDTLKEAKEAWNRRAENA